VTAQELVQKAREMGVTFKVEGDNLRLKGPNLDEFRAKYAKQAKALKDELLAFFAEEEARQKEARMEFALGFSAKEEMESDDAAPEWLAYAAWCWITDALEGFVNWGTGETYERVLEAVQDGQGKPLLERAVKNWTAAHLAYERHATQVNHPTAKAGGFPREDDAEKTPSESGPVYTG